jgi:hypothetical protein
MHSLDLSIHLVFGYGSDHHFDHRLGLSTEIRQSAKSLYLREIGRLGTSLDALPMSGGQGSGVQISPARPNPSTVPTYSDLHLTDILATLDNAEQRRSGLATEHQAEKVVPAFSMARRDAGSQP